MLTAALTGAAAGFMLALHSARVPSQPQPQPFFSVATGDSGAAVAAGAAVAGAAELLSSLRVRSLLWMLLLPPVDIATRRAIDASRLELAGVRADEEYEAAETGADAADLVGVGCAVFVVSAALPFVDIALRLSSTNSRALILFAVCAIVHPVADVYPISIL